MSLQTDSIGLLTWDYSRPKGGMGRALQHTVELLRSQGKTVNVASPQTEKPLLSMTERTGGHLLFSLLLPFVLRRWIRRESVGLLLLPVGPGGVFLLRSPGIPAAAIVYHTYKQQSGAVPGQAWKNIFIPFERLTLQRCKRIICYSTDTQRVLQEYYGIPAERISLCAHVFDTESWKGTGERIPGLCVCIARLEARKGVDVVLRAWPEVLRSVPHARLDIIGSGIQAPAIDAVIAALHGTVKRTESLPLHQLQHRVGEAQVALCPAYLEGYGLAAAEAMSAGCTVIAADSDGLRSLITHDVNGLLVPRGDVHALSAAIIRALQDDALRSRMAHAARSHIEEVCNPLRAARELMSAVEAAQVTNPSL